MCTPSAASFIRYIPPDKDQKHIPDHRGANILMPLPARKAKLELDSVLPAGKGEDMVLPRASQPGFLLLLHISLF